MGNHHWLPKVTPGTKTKVREKSLRTVNQRKETTTKPAINHGVIFCRRIPETLSRFPFSATITLGTGAANSPLSLSRIVNLVGPLRQFSSRLSMSRFLVPLLLMLSSLLFFNALCRHDPIVPKSFTWAAYQRLGLWMRANMMSPKYRHFSIMKEENHIWIPSPGIFRLTFINVRVQVRILKCGSSVRWTAVVICLNWLII